MDCILAPFDYACNVKIVFLYVYVFILFERFSLLHILTYYCFIMLVIDFVIRTIFVIFVFHDRSIYINLYSRQFCLLSLFLFFTLLKIMRNKIY